MKFNLFVLGIFFTLTLQFKHKSRLHHKIRQDPDAAVKSVEAVPNEITFEGIFY